MTAEPKPLLRQLTPRTPADDVLELYWSRADLQVFCREQGLSTAGGKRDLVDRVERFLRTGQRVNPGRTREASSPEARRVNAARSVELTMDTTAPRGFRCTQSARAFFVAHLGRTFRFTVMLQAFIKDNPGVTLRRIADEWRRQQDLRKAGVLQSEIGSQFEYNRFTHDYFADPRNAGRSRTECIEAWRRARARRGDHGYRPEE